MEGATTHHFGMHRGEHFPLSVSMCFTNAAFDCLHTLKCLFFNVL